MASGPPSLSICDGINLGRNACLRVRRVKNGIATPHPLQGDEMPALRALKDESSFVFVSERARRSLRRASPKWS